MYGGRRGSTGVRVLLVAALGAGALLAVGAAGSAAAVPGDRTDRVVLAGTPVLGAWLPPRWRRCVNSVVGYSVGYPGGWHTTRIRPAEACAQFHPTRFTIPANSEYPLTALNVRRVPALPSRTDTRYERVLRWEWTTVAGRRAVRYETMSTGEGLYPRGTRWYGYVSRLGGRLFSVHTAAQPGERRYRGWKVVVDRAASTLHLR